MNGACGFAVNQSTTSSPKDGLCGSGLPTAVNLINGNYTWSCEGQNGGSTAPCSASLPSSFAPRVFSANSDLNHQIGRPGVNGRSWFVTVLDPVGQFLNYGPYVSDLPVGQYEVSFILKVDFVRVGPTGLTLANDHVLTLDVASALGATIHTQKQVYRHDFSGNQVYTTITLSFAVTAPGAVLEFRSLYRGHSYVELERIELHRRD